MKVTSDAVVADMDNCRADFRPGVVTLKAMSNQLKALHFFKDDSCSYQADEVISLYGTKNLGVV
ncbi:uncharacterized protein BX663DRAFT_527897 [Cokeromyces recurvatus]|uniref:uncharacterized protein n=1 Tax=Cokeromyces recurvatus TaxID=90255 RepID=UPI00221FE61F|nr:uncharacterized protein BX663DRAFT_527897 [Cokeromyces recurvatus]KAI7897585.1 hypothetical protein BX663DRAFT_527897 [Cokeromyces recurvatus]